MTRNGTLFCMEYNDHWVDVNMRAEQRQEAIEERLKQALNPDYLEVINESHLHAGHAGAREGKSHFRVIIASEQFNDRALLGCHQLVYQALGEMMRQDIHALAIEIKRQS